MREVTVGNKTFELFIDADTLAERVRALGQQLNSDFADKKPLFLVLLKGAYVFASDLIKHFEHECTLSFFRLSSYRGMESSGELMLLDTFGTEIQNRHVIVVEDIVDTGNTLSAFLPALKSVGPASVQVVSLLSKPEVLQGKIHIDYLGFEIPPAFVVGYGLDYNEAGRNFPAIYQLKK
jgi:hypoxanthine phosphoribosyltransferase